MRAFVLRWPRKGYERVTKKKISGTTRGFLSRLGPGLITGASDDDPSGIGTYSQAGAQLGFGIGWTMLLTYPSWCEISKAGHLVGPGRYAQFR
jgi:Mn2+/Fe2+ NRAMP family transporter